MSTLNNIMSSDNTFKSATNRKIEQKSTQEQTRTSGEVTISLKANYSIITDVPYPRELKQTPMVMCSLQASKDKDLTVRYHIEEVDAKKFTVALENTEDPINVKQCETNVTCVHKVIELGALRQALSEKIIIENNIFCDCI